LRCMQPVGGTSNGRVKATINPSAPSLPPSCSRWKVLRRKAVGLFVDGLGRSPGLQSEQHSSSHRLSSRPTTGASLQRLEYSHLLILYFLCRSFFDIVLRFYSLYPSNDILLVFVLYCINAVDWVTGIGSSLQKCCKL